MNKKILMALTIILSATYFNSSVFAENTKQDVKLEVKSKSKIPVVGDLVDIKDNVMNEINAMIAEIKSSIVAKASGIGKGSPDEILGNVKNFLVLLKQKLPAIVTYVDKAMEHVKKIENVAVVKQAGDVTKITPKLKVFLGNVSKSIKNLQDAITYILNDLETPVKEAQELMIGIKKAGVFDLGKK